MNIRFQVGSHDDDAFIIFYPLQQAEDFLVRIFIVRIADTRSRAEKMLALATRLIRL